MTRLNSIEHEFVEFIPHDLEPGKLYVSIPYRTMSHLCACGCNSEVVTPISPVGWSLEYDGERVSLKPSIGSWSLPCKSHYFINRNKVVWAAAMSDAAIARVKARDKTDLARHYGASEVTQISVQSVPLELSPAPDVVAGAASKTMWWKVIKRWFGSRE